MLKRPRFARTDTTFMRLKIRTVDFLEWLLGGPYVYDGPDLFVAHASMHIDSWVVVWSQQLGL